MDKTEQEIIRILLENSTSGLKEKDVSMNTWIVQDLGYDSMQLIELIVTIERSFGFSVPDEMLAGENFSTIGSVCELVNRVIG